ncbi:MAG TPA: hypothetical protein VFN26_06145 [Candidatus Acidoferrum sp.]|nr:hypothetical protein [Candidatus Acidoferrum sp.]
MQDENSSSNPFESDAKDAAQQTDKELAGAEATLATVTWDELKKMLPSPADQQQLSELMKIVQAATDHNEKVASLIDNIGTLGGIVIKVLSRVPGA